MISIVEPFVKYIRRPALNTTNWSFKLICHFNVFLLLCFMAFMSATQFFGVPIDCYMDRNILSKETINNFCWIMGIYIPRKFNASTPSSMISSWHGGNVAEQDKVYLLYYQWVALIYLLMAASYVLPNYIWKKLEGGRLNGLVSGFTGPLHGKVWDHEKRASLVQYFLVNSGSHFWYAAKFFISQLILVVVCFGNIYVIDRIFDDFWTTYRPAVSSLFNWNYYAYTEHTGRIFPRMAKCHYSNFGGSGSEQVFDALCILPLNILNEKVFTFLYVWLILLAVVATFELIYSAILAMCFYFRVKILASMTLDKQYKKALDATGGHLGDFFMLYMIGKNVYPYVFTDLISELALVRRNSSGKKTNGARVEEEEA